MLAIAGGKGGSGKTTTTLGLAAALDGPVLAADADVDMPDLHAMAGVPREPTLADLTPPVEGRVGHPRDEQVSVLPAPLPAAGSPGERSRETAATWMASASGAAEASAAAGGTGTTEATGATGGTETGKEVGRARTAAVAGGDEGTEPGAGPATESGRRRDRALRRGLAALSGLDRRVLLDCPPGAGPDVATALRAADAALVVTAHCGPALRDAAKTAALARAVGTPAVGAVLTRTRLRPAPAADLLGCPVLAAVPAVEPPVLPTDVVRGAYARLASRLPAGENVL